MIQSFLLGLSIFSEGRIESVLSNVYMRLMPYNVCQTSNV